MNTVMAKVAYKRVSTVEQSTERQLDGLTFDKVFEDAASAKDMSRPKLEAMIEYVREGDTIHVHDLSRLARDLGNLLSLVKTLNEKGVAVTFHKENLTFNGKDDAIQNLMLSMLGAVYQFERSMLLERQREGIAIAKRQGKYKGAKKRIDDQKILSELDKGTSIRKTAEKLNVGVSTVQRAKNSYKNL